MVWPRRNRVTLLHGGQLLDHIYWSPASHGEVYDLADGVNTKISDQPYEPGKAVAFDDYRISTIIMEHER